MANGSKRTRLLRVLACALSSLQVVTGKKPSAMLSPTHCFPWMEPLSSTDLDTITSMVLHLEHYSREQLMELPLKLRQALLLSLPVADIRSLQQTEFVQDIDMDYVWRMLFCFRVPRMLLKFTSSPMSRFSKKDEDFYMELICSILLNRSTFSANGFKNYRILVLSLMFSIKGAPVINQWRSRLENDCDDYLSMLKQSLHVGRPNATYIVPASRYREYFTRNVSDTELAWLIQSKCLFSATQVNVHGPCFTRRTCVLMGQKNGIPINLLHPFQHLGEAARSLWFMADEHDERASVKTLLLAVSELTRETTLNLRDVCIHAGNAQSLQVHLQAVASFFSKYSTRRTTHWNSPFFAPIPHTGLEELILSTDNSQCCYPAPPSSPDVFASIISSQESLSRLSLIGICLQMPPHKMRRITSALMDFVHRLSMQVTNIVDLSLPFSLFQLITGYYLSSKARNKQTLYYHTVKICDTDQPFYTHTHGKIGGIHMQEAQVDYRSLQFQKTILDNKVLSWLFSPHFRLCFNTLDFHDIALGSVDLLGILAQHPNLQVKYMFLTSLQLHATRDTVDDLQLLISKDKLESLTIARCSLGGRSVFTKLTQALMNQVVRPEKPTSIESLSVMAGGLGSEETEDIKLFFVSLRLQKVCLGLDIRGNGLTPQHFELMCDVWNSFHKRGKLKVLMCGGNELPEDVSCLNAVASKVLV